MIIIYDLQQALTNVDAGNFDTEGPINARYTPPTTARIEGIEDIKSICIYDRSRIESGIDIRIKDIPGVMEGDRITVTGRIGTNEMVGNKFWSVALIASYPEDGQITQHIAPSPVFSVSHTLEKAQLNLVLFVHTVFWGNYEPLMDLYIDSILVTRQEVHPEDETDTRSVVYKFEAEPDTEIMAFDTAQELGKNAPFIYCSGLPAVRIIKHGEVSAIHVGNRFNDWDGIDINIARMELHPANQYKITVTGRIDGDAPPDAIIMLQGIPGYVWKNTTAFTSNYAFTLEYIMSRSEVERWGAIRITTNAEGAAVPFFIYSIDIVRL
ncbi:MAG: hypothetical protein FWE27_08550 [Defluviitaleaceae bacterium]|nr:hypothetical protein [Defluviitaleaceae bacterium]